MPFTFGYELESSNRVVTPPLLHDKISVSSAGNTTHWVFYGTRKEILDWMREHSDIELQNVMFSGGQPVTFQTHTELVIDLQYIVDSEQTYLNYFKSFVVSDYAIERVKCEIRPRLESKDNMIMTLCRTIVRSGTKLGEVVDELQHEWHKPAKSYYQQTVDMFSDKPAPVHFISADGPTSIRVGEDQAVQTEPPKAAESEQPSNQQETLAH